MGIELLGVVVVVAVVFTISFMTMWAIGEAIGGITVNETVPMSEKKEIIEAAYEAK